MWGLLAQTCTELCQHHPGCAVGSFSVACRPGTPFWPDSSHSEHSSAHEVLLQPFIAVLKGFPSALLAPGRRSFLTGPHLFSIPAEATFVQVFFPADSLLDAPALPQTLAAFILMPLVWLLI